MPPLRIYFDKHREWAPVRLPGSKSIAARALISRYVQGANTQLLDLPDCDDTKELNDALEKLSAIVPNPKEAIKKRESVIYPGTLYLGNGGTTLRFMLALLASIPELEIEIDCGDMLRRRPLAPLIEALRSSGADIQCLKREGYPPLFIKGRRLDGSKTVIKSAGSSQFLSAMMLASPLWESPLNAKMMESAVSYPYIEMTRKVMQIFQNPPAQYYIEGDWSAAGYFYELALACPGRKIIIENLPAPDSSIQGDALCCDMMDFLGVNTTGMNGEGDRIAVIEGSTTILNSLRLSNFLFDTNMSNVPDLVPAVSVGLCLANIPFIINGIGHLRLKESDRIAALCAELSKAGYAVDAGPDGNSLVWSGRRYPVADDETYEAWGDHRIVMALAILATKNGWLAISGAEAVSKSFPSFFAQLGKLGFNFK